MELCCRFGPEALRWSRGCEVVRSRTVEERLATEWDVRARTRPERAAALARAEADSAKERVKRLAAARFARRQSRSGGRGGGRRKDSSARSESNGWEQAIDPGTKRVYYFHRASGRSSWDPPANWRPEGKGAAPTDDDARDEDDDDDMTRARKKARQGQEKQPGLRTGPGAG